MTDDVLEEDRFDFDDAERTLEGRDRDQDSLSHSLKEEAELLAGGTYELGKYISKPAAVTVPVGAGLAALTNTPIEVGAGAGVSGALLYKVAKESLEMDSMPDAGEAAAIAGMGAGGPVGGYAVSKADEAVSYGTDKLGELADLGGEAYGAVTGAATDAANYAATEGMDMLGQAVGASDEVALGVGAGLASLMAGAYGLERIDRMRNDGSEFEDEYDL